MIALLTDSTCDLPADVLAKLSISVFPMTIKVHGATYLDRVNLSSDAFYAQIATSDSHPECR